MRISDWSSDVCSSDLLSRAVHGVARPVFYRGEQIGERRYFDERLTQFILRRRDPVRFGDWRDGREAVQHFDGPALILARLLSLAEDRSEEHTSELQSLMRNSYAVFCLKKKKKE